MAHNLDDTYPGKTTVDGNNPKGTFKNRTSDILKDGTPFERQWASDVWGFLSHVLNQASITPDGSEENESVSQIFSASRILFIPKQYLGDGTDFTVSGPGAWSTVRAVAEVYQTLNGAWIFDFQIRGTHVGDATPAITVSGILAKDVANFTQTYSALSSGFSPSRASISQNTNVFNIVFSGAATDTSLSGKIELKEKPTFAD